MRALTRFSLVLLLLGAALGAGCRKQAAGSSAPSSAAPQHKSLYQRLGGDAAITAVVNDFVDNVAADARINHFFVDTDLGHLKRQIAALVAQVAGGPALYTGQDMKTVHASLGIAEPDFNALVEDLVKSLDKFKVPETEKGELLGLLGGMKGDIVTK